MGLHSGSAGLSSIAVLCDLCVPPCPLRWSSWFCRQAGALRAS